MNDATAFTARKRTLLEERHAEIVHLCIAALTGSGEEACKLHQEVCSLVPPGIYEDTSYGYTLRVLGTARERTAAGHERYFVLLTISKTSSRKPAARRLLVGHERGEKSGWFNYLIVDGVQKQRFVRVPGK